MLRSSRAWARRAFFGSFLLLAACGGDVIASPGQAGDEASGSGAAGNTGSGAGNAGAGAGATGSSAEATSTSGSGDAPSVCGGSFVEVIADIESTTLGSICAGSWGAEWTSTPVGYYINGGPAPGVHNLAIEGCSAPSNGSESLRLGAADADVPGGYAARVVFIDANGGTWEELEPGTAKLELTSVGQVGGVIEGSYGANLVNGEIVQTVQGSFRVCRVDDENVP